MRIKFKRANRAVLVDEDFTEEEKAFWRLVFESEEMNRKNVIFVPNDEKAEKLGNLFENLAEAMSDQEVRIVRKLPGHGEGPLDTMNCATVSLKGKSIVFTQEHYGFLRYTDIFEATTRLDKLVQMNFQVNDFDDERRIDCEKNTIDVCTNEIKKYAERKNLELDNYFEVYLSLLTIHDIISYELLHDLFENKEQSLSRKINEYYHNFELFDNEDHLTCEYENGYLKSLTILPNTHEIFIEFTTYYACFDNVTLNLRLFSWCKAIGFSVQEEDEADDYMTVGLLLDSPFVSERRNTYEP